MMVVRTQFRWAYRALFAAGAALAGISAIEALAPPAEAAKPALIFDQCNQTSGDGMGHECPNPTDLLIRPKYEGGFCGDWMCCPVNPDGKTYNCAAATNPTLVGPGIKDRFKEVMGDRAGTFDPGPKKRDPKGEVAPKLKPKKLERE